MKKEKLKKMYVEGGKRRDHRKSQQGRRKGIK